jgi:hypothetical protein
MSAPRRPSASPEPQHPGGDPAVNALLEYLAATSMSPPPDLTTRIHARIALEPDRTPPRRFVLALLHLRLATAIGAFRQVVQVAAGRGRFPTLIRAQALGLVLVAALGAVALGMGAAAGLQRLFEEHPNPTPSLPTPTLPSPASPMPTTDGVVVRSPVPSPDMATPGPSPLAESRVAQPTPATPERPRATVKPSKAGSDAVSRATPRPAATPRPTPRPRPEQRPEPTPRPTHKPQATEHPEPTETPEADGHDGGDDSGGGDGGGEDAPDETDPPEG